MRQINIVLENMIKKSTNYTVCWIDIHNYTHSYTNTHAHIPVETNP